MARIEDRLADLDANLVRVEQLLRASIASPKPDESTRFREVRVDRPFPTQVDGPRPPIRERKGREPAATPTLIAVPDLSGPGPTVATQADAARRSLASNDLARRFARVWAMADQGAKADRIAEATGQPLGQVELVMNLRRHLLDDPPGEATR